MAEILSRQAAAAAANQKLIPAKVAGKQRVVIIQTPATHAIANGDTLASGVRLPVGTRLLAGSFVSRAALGASATINIGLRDWKTKVALSATAVASALDVAAAGVALANNGAYVAAGIDYVTTQETELYITFTGATPTASAQLRAEISILNTD